MKKYVWLSVLAVLLLIAVSAAGEPSVRFEPENPRVGDYVDVTITPGREDARTAAWSLTMPDGTEFSGKDTEHFAASFRPRMEGEYMLTVTVSWGKKDTETASAAIRVSGTAPVQQGADTVYSQKDGWWLQYAYSKKHSRSLQKSGCAIFALSHALQRMGVTGEEALPDRLAEDYSYCYINERGTDNELLLTCAGERFGFATAAQLVESEKGLRTCFRLGDMFSFSVAIGHIALADGLSEDETRVHVVDSAVSATFERLKNAHVYYRDTDGVFVEAASPADLPGIRWFFETGEYGGAEYWMDLSYCARRGMRMIRPDWLTLVTEEGSVPVSMEYAGTVQSMISEGDESRLVPTRSLRWICTGSEGMQLARVTRRGTAFTDAEGKGIPRIKALQPGALVPVLSAEEQRLYVYYRGTFGYILKSNAELLYISGEDCPTALVSVNGKTAGTAEVAVRLEPNGKKSQYAWTVGTPVVLLKESKGFWLAEGSGVRGWIDSDYITPVTGEKE